MGVGLAAIMGFLVAPVIGWRAVFFVSAASALVAFVVRTHLPESHLWESQREERLSPRQALALLVRHRLVGVTLKGFVLAVLQAGDLLDLLHLAAEVPADRDAPADRPVGASGC